MKLSMLKHIPGCRQLNEALRRHYNPSGENPFLQYAPPGHFYSPIPDMDFVQRHRDRLFARSIAAIPGIEIHADAQCALVAELARFYPEMPFAQARVPGLRYHFANDFFGHADAIVLYSMLRRFRPRRVIEVGSGFSSAVMLDTNDRFLSGEVTLTFVEPNPNRLLSLLDAGDMKKHEVIVDEVQNVPLERFAALQENDILFIDSSHIAKIGSDVVHLLTHVLPMLQKGVLIHFHDIFWPFEYPEESLRKGIAWNENYVLKAFLQFNAEFRVRLFNDYLAIHHRQVMERHLPLFVHDTGASLWMQRNR